MRQFQTLLIISSFFFLVGCSQNNKTPTKQAVSCDRPKYAIVIHGGAGTIKKENMSPEKEKAYQQKLNEALDVGENILKNGGSSMDAVEATIQVMENSPLFNSGKGAVFTHTGTHELDASFMDGTTLNAGAVGGVSIVKNPIRAARLVMTNSPHVLLTGRGADQFAIEQGLDTVPNTYFDTDSRRKSLEKALEKENNGMGYLDQWPDYKYGTVGCVALDKNGHIAAGTSTGGMTNKKYNRIGDSPIIGAGTYANNQTCGVSCTGHGEYYIRYAVAHDLSAQLEYTDRTLQQAANEIIHHKLIKAGGDGGLIAIDKCGNIVMDFNTAGMYRGFAKPGERVVKIYK